jgi:hypothetical protein
MQGRQAARKRGELAAAGCELAGWKTWRLLSMCQEQIKSLRATEDFAGFLPWRAAIRR